MTNQQYIVEATSIEAFDALRDHINDVVFLPEWLKLTEEQEETEREIRQDLICHACDKFMAIDETPCSRMPVDAFFVQNEDDTWAPDSVIEITHIRYDETETIVAGMDMDEQKMLIIRPKINRDFGPVRAPKNPDELGAAVLALQESSETEPEFRAAMLASGMINDDDRIIEIKVCAGEDRGIMTYLNDKHVITTLVKDKNLIVMSGIEH